MASTLSAARALRTVLPACAILAGRALRTCGPDGGGHVGRLAVAVDVVDRVEDRGVDARLAARAVRGAVAGGEPVGPGPAAQQVRA